MSQVYDQQQGYYVVAPTQYEEDWSDIIEPYTSMLALGADAVGLATLPSVALAPVGAAIATVGNIPNLVVDGYQTVRDWNRTISDGAPVKNALFNTFELGLGLFGLSAINKGVKFVNDRAVSREIQGLIKDQVRRRSGQRVMLRKRGMTDAEINAYLGMKAANAVMNSRHVKDLKAESASKTKKQTAAIGYLANMPLNAYHAGLVTAPADNTRTAPVIIFNTLKK